MLGHLTGRLVDIIHLKLLDEPCYVGDTRHEVACSPLVCSNEGSRSPLLLCGR